jgi:hypothetical protein
MAKRVPAGQCVYCLGEFDSLTEDHVFPASYYPDSTPANISKPKVPACLKCNGDFSKIENEILIPIGLCLDGDHPAASGIPQKALRAMDPREGKSPRDREHRLAKFRQMGRRMLEAGSKVLPEDGSGIMPGFGKWPGGDERDRVDLDGIHLQKLTRKLVRGFTFLETKRLITADYVIETGLLQEKAGREFIERLRRPRARHLGPGLIMTCVRWKKDLVVHAIEYRVWEKLRLYACVGRADMIEPNGDAWELVYGPRAEKREAYGDAREEEPVPEDHLPVGEGLGSQAVADRPAGRGGRREIAWSPAKQGDSDVNCLTDRSKNRAGRLGKG